MTSTETKPAPRKRAPRKTAAAVDPAAAKADGVDARKAENVRAQLEAAAGEEITAGAVRRLRGGVAGYKVIRPDGEPTPAERRAAAAAHSDDPGPVAPGLEEDPDAGVDQVEAVPATAAVTLEAPDGERGVLIGPADKIAALVRPEAVVDPSPATPPAELPAGVIACGPGDLDPADAAAIAAFAGDLEQRAAAGLHPCPQANGAPCSLSTANPGCCAFEAADVVDGAEVDLRSLVAVDLGPGVEAFDLTSLVAGRVDTAPDGRRVTVWDRAAAIVEVMNAAEQVRAVNAPTFDPAAHAAVRAAYDVAAVAGDVVNLEGGDPTQVKLSAVDAAAIEEARQLEARAGELKEAAEAIRSRVKEKLGGEEGTGEVALAPDGTVLARWSRVTSTKCSTTALKKARPEVWAEFAVTTVSRRFTWAD